MQYDDMNFPQVQVKNLIIAASFTPKIIGIVIQTPDIAFS